MDPYRFEKPLSDRIRAARLRAGEAHRRAAKVHLDAADLFERAGRWDKAAAARLMADRELEGAETERAAALSQEHGPVGQARLN